MSSVERLQTLLSRVQRNRSLPRGLSASESVERPIAFDDDGERVSLESLDAHASLPPIEAEVVERISLAPEPEPAVEPARDELGISIAPPEAREAISLSLSPDADAAPQEVRISIAPPVSEPAHDDVRISIAPPELRDEVRISLAPAEPGDDEPLISVTPSEPGDALIDDPAADEDAFFPDQEPPRGSPTMLDLSVVVGNPITAGGLTPSLLEGMPFKAPARIHVPQSALASVEPEPYMSRSDDLESIDLTASTPPLPESMRMPPSVPPAEARRVEHQRFDADLPEGAGVIKIISVPPAAGASIGRLLARSLSARPK